MSSSYESRLGRELTAVGISGRLRRRILAEIADHLATDPDARLGDPSLLAWQFADELGTERALTAAIAGFAALAVAGVLFAAAFLSSGPGPFGASPHGEPVIGRVATWVALLAPQVSFVAGVLAALRWLRRRRSNVLPAAEATVIVRRAALGVLAGMATMVSLGAIAIIDRHYITTGWMWFAVVAAGLGCVVLSATVPSVWAAIRLRPVASGPAGDIFDDLGGLVPARLRGRPWRLAVIIAAVVALLITLAAVPASDEFDGAVRGIGDALVCLFGFATLGRYLGLWGSGGRDPSCSEGEQLTPAD
jgi:hypothetical protein